MNISTLIQLLNARQGNGLPGVPRPARPLPLGPIPLAPYTGLEPLSDDTTAAYNARNLEPVLPQLVQPGPADQSFVGQYTGQAPAPPAPLSKLQRIMNAIGGFGAGYSGQGPQFLESLRAPQRTYERERGQYEERRTRGIELAERRAEREAEQANRANAMLYESEYKKWLSKNDNRSDEAKTRVAQAFIRERDATAARLEADREVQRERRQLERDARAIEERYFTASKNRALSRELGRHWSGLSDAPLSPAAARLDHALAGVGEVRMRRAASVGGGTGGGSSSVVQNTLAEFETLKQMAIQAVKAKGGTPQEEIEAVRRATLPVVRKMARQPRLFEVGTGQYGYPYAQPRGAGQQQQPQAQAKTITRAEMAALGVTEAQARAEGYTITQ